MKTLLIISGFLSLGIGTIGIILPLLPTTPFLILTGVLFAKGSYRFHNWFTESRIYKKHLKDFMDNRTMKRRNKWILLLSVDLMLLSTFLMLDNILIRVTILVLVMIKHYYFHKYINVIS